LANKPRILIVDDDRCITDTIKAGLKHSGCEVDAFTQSMDALSDYKPNYYAGIILAVRMPKMSGFELARNIWKQEPNAKVCFLSAFEINEKEAKWLFPHLKSWCFLTKPVTVAHVLSHLEKKHEIRPWKNACVNIRTKR
jgi:DNA-binding response OmpR family regulator